MDTSAIVSILSLAVALAALIIAPYFAHRQSVAQMRQAWINSLRDSVAEFLSLVCTPDLAFAYRERDAEIPVELYSKMMLLESKIELLLNPREESHSRLITAIHDLVNLIHQKQREIGQKEFYDIKADFELSITKITQDIIRHEWTRTKRFIR
jgi:hypothetical protein